MGFRVPRTWSAALLAVAACACDAGRLAEAPKLAPAPAEEPVVAVETAPLRRGVLARRIAAPGSVVARRESRIGAEIAGRIVRVHVAEGDRVEAGTPLFEIDPVPFEMALRQAEAGADLARAERRQIEADLARAEALRRQKLLAPQEMERLRTSLAVAVAAERQAAEAVALARHNVSRTVVHAPYAGSIAARLADEGTTALVQPQTIVVVLQETAHLEAHAAIPESQMALVRPGDPALVSVEGLPEPVQTEVASVSDTIDPATRTYLVKMPVPNPERRIKAGVFAHVEVHARGSDAAVLAPREAIRVEDGRARLLVVEAGRAAALPVEVGPAADGEAEILAGADVGVRAIVGEAARTLAPGMRVRVVAPGAESAS